MIDQATLQKLKNIYTEGNISFFLGAGISIRSGIPSWKDLVTAMYFRYMAAESWGRLKPYPNYLYAASKHFIKKLEESPDIIVRKLKSGWGQNAVEYKVSLWDSLYSSRINNNVIDQYAIEYSPRYIADTIIKNPSRAKVKSIITYNFDDVLEEVFDDLNYHDYKTVYEPTKIPPGMLPIFHVHGFVPFNNNEVDKKNYGNIILGEDDYNNLMNDSNNWANLIQLTTIASSANIMIGLSLADRNLRRILDITSKQAFNSSTYIFLKKPEIKPVTPEEITQIDYDARLLLNKWTLGGGIKSSFNVLDQLDQILQGIMQNDVENNDKVLKEMGVTPIWVDDYNEIAAYLKYMIE